MRFPTTDLSAWGQGGTEGGPFASFVLRYRLPLQSYAERRLSLPADFAEEVTARFLARELEREAGGQGVLFRLYDGGSGKKFRSLLATVFWRFARDELEKERRRGTLDLEQLPESSEPSDDELCRLVAREFFSVLRDQIAARIQPKDLAILELKWPMDPSRSPLPNSQIERELGLTRAQVRTRVGHIGAAFLAAVREHAERSQVDPGDLVPFLHDACLALDRDDRVRT